MEPIYTAGFYDGKAVNSWSGVEGGEQLQTAWGRPAKAGQGWRLQATLLLRLVQLSVDVSTTERRVRGQRTGVGTDSVLSKSAAC